MLNAKLLVFSLYFVLISQQNSFAQKKLPLPSLPGINPPPLSICPLFRLSSLQLPSLSIPSGRSIFAIPISSNRQLSSQSLRLQA
jgi:hypothetical protein